MNVYARNRSCPCERCRIRGLMSAGILIAVGFLFLLENYGIVYVNITVPVIMIVVGLFLLASHNASTEGHIQPFGIFGSSAPNSSRQNNSQVTS